MRPIEQANLIDADAAATMAAHGACVVPTMVTSGALEPHGAARGMDPRRLAKNAEVRAAGLAAFGILRTAGSRVGFGSDLHGPLRDLRSQEFVLRAEVERPADIVRSATSINAGLIQRPDLARIATGPATDLLVVEGDLLEDVGVLAHRAETLRLVMTVGRTRVESLAHRATDGARGAPSGRPA